MASSGHSAGASTSWMPLGFEFRPTDRELVVFYLMKYLSGQSLPSDAVGYADVYAKDPYELMGDSEEAFFISPRRRASDSSPRVQRSTPSGTWKMDKQSDIGNGSGAVIAHKAMLSFHFHTDNRSTGWVMYEYVLGSKAASKNSFQEVGICHIRGSLRARDVGRAMRIEKTEKEEDTPAGGRFVDPSTVHGLVADADDHRQEGEPNPAESGLPTELMSWESLIPLDTWWDDDGYIDISPELLEEEEPSNSPSGLAAGVPLPPPLDFHWSATFDTRSMSVGAGENGKEGCSAKHYHQQPAAAPGSVTGAATTWTNNSFITGKGKGKAPVWGS